MDFTQLDIFKIVYYLVMLIAFFGIMAWLVKSAMDSLKRTGGKWSSIFDEIFIGFIVLVAFTIIAQMDPGTPIEFLKRPIMWVFDLVLKALRLIGIQI